MAEDAKSKEQANNFITLMRQKGQFICEPGYIFRPSQQLKGCDVEANMVNLFRNDPNGRLPHESVQVLRVLGELVYGDAFLIHHRAEAFKKTGQLVNAVDDPKYVTALLKKCVHAGLVTELVYLDPLNRSASGDILTPAKNTTVVAYCLNTYGVEFFKRQTESNVYLDEFLAVNNALDIMRTLAVNHIMETMRRHHAGKTEFAKSVHYKGQRRQKIYGMQSSDKECIVYEPVFFCRDKTLQTASELQEHYASRCDFLREVYKGCEGRKALVIVLEYYEELKYALQAMKDVIALCDETYITTDALVYISDVKMQDKPCPLLKTSIVYKDGKNLIAHRYELPEWWKEEP